MRKTILWGKGMGKYYISGFADEIADDLETQISSVKSLGLSFIEMRRIDGINLIYHDDAKILDIKSKLSEAGIKVSAIASPIGKISINEPFEPHFEQFKRAVEIAQILNTKNIRMFSFVLPEGRKKKYKEKVFNRIRQLVDYAIAHDIVLLHENEKDTYGEMARECRELMDEFGGEHFKAIFDFAAFVQARQDTIKAYELLKNHIECIHVKDAMYQNGNIVPAGMGDGKVPEILRRLHWKDYQGFICLEPQLDHFAEAIVQEEVEKAFAVRLRGLSSYESFLLAQRSLFQILV